MLKYSQLRSSPRVDLVRESPIPIPFTLLVETTNVCNFRCEMCPESLPDYQAQAGYYQRLPRELFRKLLNDLKAWDGRKIKSFKIYLEGEPLLNPVLPEMIREVRDAGVAERIELTTNASLLTPELSERLVNSGLDYIRISIYALDDLEYQKITKSKWTASKIISNIRLLREVRDRMGSTIPILYAQWLERSVEENEEFRGIFSEIVDEVGIELRHNWAMDGNLVNIGTKSLNGRKVCPEIFYTLSVKANGDVSACCIDWNGQLIIGDLKKESLKEIWEGQKLHDLRKIHLEGRRGELSMCGTCTLIHNFPDNLDNLTVNDFETRRLVNA